MNSDKITDKAIMKKIMIAAPKSGSGKTLLTTGLLSIFKRQGYKTSAFKCGPDYIDPMFHRSVLGVPSHNLDLFFTDRKTTRDIFSTALHTGHAGDNVSAADSVAVIEGVMGLYDGLGGTSSVDSSYDLAEALNASIVLILDAKGAGYSLIPQIKGMLDYDRSHLIRAVILNRIPERFYLRIRGVIEQELPQIIVAGYIPEKKEFAVSSRHLGLFMPDEIPDLKEKTDQTADTLSATVDTDRLLAVMEDFEREHAGSDNIISEDIRDDSKSVFHDDGIKNIYHSASAERCRVAYAYDEAFCFYYQENLDMLRAAGLELVPFSPIHDSSLPDHIDGIILGGGYPELHEEELKANTSMTESVRQALLPDFSAGMSSVSGRPGMIKAGLEMPSLAECGGFMYLMKNICGIRDSQYENKGHLVRFGYVTLKEKQPHFLKADESIRGHEFHHFDSDDNGSDATALKGDIQWDCCDISDSHFWGFPHLYYPSTPQFVQSFSEKVYEYHKLIS